MNQQRKDIATNERTNNPDVPCRRTIIRHTKIVIDALLAANLIAFVLIVGLVILNAERYTPLLCVLALMCIPPSVAWVTWKCTGSPAGTFVPFNNDYPYGACVGHIQYASETFGGEWEPLNSIGYVTPGASPSVVHLSLWVNSGRRGAMGFNVLALLFWGAMIIWRTCCKESPIDALWRFILRAAA